MKWCLRDQISPQRDYSRRLQRSAGRLNVNLSNVHRNQDRLQHRKETWRKFDHLELKKQGYFFLPRAI